MGDASLGRLVAGRYELVGVLGEGTFGVVYDAVHRVIGRRVAVKILREDIGRDPELVQRFQLEARAAGALGHRNIVQIFDAGQMEEGDRAHFLVMERVEGISLASEVLRGPMVIARAVDIAAQVLSGLSAAHRRSIVHRDLKPENILLGVDEEGKEVAKIVDFGISKVLDPARLGVAADVRVTAHGELLGTPLYMAPEQAAGEDDIDQRADLWALGCVLYEMVCGRPPFLGESFTQILAALLRDPPLMPGTLRAEITPALEAVIMAALSKDRADRPADAVQMRTMLLAAAAERPSASPFAVSAAAPAGPDEAALVAALSRAVALELADGGGGGLPPPPAAPPPELEPEPPMEMDLAPVAPLRPRSAPVRAQTPPPDVFAPPDAVEAPVALLDVDRGLLRTSQRRTTVDSPMPARVAMAASPRRGVSFAGLVSALIILALLAAGGLAVYRYLTLGYIWRPGGGAIELQLAITPTEAELMLDGAPLDADHVTVEDGSRHELTARAPGRLALRRELVGSRDMERRVDVRLTNALRPLGSQVAPAAPTVPLPRPSGSAADVDQALGKLDLYRACLALVAPDLASARAAYEKTARGVPTIELLAATEVDQCRADVERAVRLAPSLGPVDAVAADFVDAMFEVDARARRLATYYQSGEFRVDGRKLGRKNHEPLLRAYGVAQARAAELMDLVERATSDWQAHELDFLRERDAGHRMLRRVALAARRRARAELRPGADDRAAAAVELERALTAAREASVAAGPAADLLAAAAAAPADGAAAADWAAWHDRLVAVFNQLETR